MGSGNNGLGIIKGSAVWPTLHFPLKKEYIINSYGIKSFIFSFVYLDRLPFFLSFFGIADLPLIVAPSF